MLSKNLTTVTGTGWSTWSSLPVQEVSIIFSLSIALIKDQRPLRGHTHFERQTFYLTNTTSHSSVRQVIQVSPP